MCKMMDDMRAAAAKEAAKEAAKRAAKKTAKEAAKRMLLRGKLTFQEIAEDCDLTLAEVENLAKELGVPVN